MPIFSLTELILAHYYWNASNQLPDYQLGNFSRGIELNTCNYNNKWNLIKLIVNIKIEFDWIVLFSHLANWMIERRREFKNYIWRSCVSWSTIWGHIYVLTWQGVSQIKVLNVIVKSSCSRLISTLSAFIIENIASKDHYLSQLESQQI